MFSPAGGAMQKPHNVCPTLSRLQMSNVSSDVTDNYGGKKGAEAEPQSPLHLPSNLAWVEVESASPEGHRGKCGLLLMKVGRLSA